MIQVKRTFLVASILLFLFSYSPIMAQYSVGQTVNNFTLNNLNGQPVSLADFSGKVKVLNFFATW